MNSNEVLVRKEGEGRGYYERCGAEAGIPEISRIFAMISDDEVRHADALRALQREARVDLGRSTTLEGARPILRSLLKQGGSLSSFNGDLASYRQAMDFEATNARLCSELARQAAHRWERELYQKMAAEDEIHFTLLEQMRELLDPAIGLSGMEGRGGDGK
jgi:rubrerythrin